jgi:hypothetical protein
LNLRQNNYLYGGPEVEITWSGRSVAHQPKGGWIRLTRITKNYILIDFLKLEPGDNSKKPFPI